MFRTIIINSGEKIKLKDNWLFVETEDGDKTVPIDDIYSVVLDNQNILITPSVVNAITNNGGHIVICDKKHMPASEIFLISKYYRPLTVQRNQLELRSVVKDEIWKRIVSEKISNQAIVLATCTGNNDATRRLYELSNEIIGGDINNCEGVAAKMFFRNMFGSDFIRMNDDSINSALNYGYAIIRSSVSKSLIGHGFNCVLGLHRINIYNSFNLSDDVMEPLRPMVDKWVGNNYRDLVDELTKENRVSLANIINEYVLINGKQMQLRSAIDVYVKSLSKTIETEIPSHLKIPKILK